LINAFNYGDSDHPLLGVRIITMARPLRIEYERAFYHVTSRGNERKEIFRGPDDYERFKHYLWKSMVSGLNGLLPKVVIIIGNQYCSLTIE